MKYGFKNKEDGKSQALPKFIIFSQNVFPQRVETTKNFPHP
jgi:hypothetical protein